MYKCINYCKILDLNELSDHCPIEMSLTCNICTPSKRVVIEKILWDDTCNEELFLKKLICFKKIGRLP